MRLIVLTYLRPALMLFAALLFGFAPQIAAAEDSPQPKEYPRILKAIEQQGLTILGEMKVPGGLRAFAAKAGAQPLTIYLTPDGEHVVVGTLVDEAGQDMAEAQLKEMVEAPIPEEGWEKLEGSTWVQDGRPDAPRTVYRVYGSQLPLLPPVLDGCQALGRVGQGTTPTCHGRRDQTGFPSQGGCYS